MIVTHSTRLLFLLLLLLLTCLLTVNAAPTETATLANTKNGAIVKKQESAGSIVKKVAGGTMSVISAGVTLFGAWMAVQYFMGVHKNRKAADKSDSTAAARTKQANNWSTGGRTLGGSSESIQKDSAEEVTDDGLMDRRVLITEWTKAMNLKPKEAEMILSKLSSPKDKQAARKAQENRAQNKDSTNTIPIAMTYDRVDGEWKNVDCPFSEVDNLALKLSDGNIALGYVRLEGSRTRLAFMAFILEPNSPPTKGLRFGIISTFNRDSYSDEYMLHLSGGHASEAEGESDIMYFLPNRFTAEKGM